MPHILYIRTQLEFDVYRVHKMFGYVVVVVVVIGVVIRGGSGNGNDALVLYLFFHIQIV